MFKLSHGYVSGLYWPECVYCMSSGIVLRFDWSVCSDWNVRSWRIFCCFVDCMFKLSDFNISTLNRLKCVHFMSSGVVLRDGGLVCSYRCLCDGQIFGFFFDCMFELSDGYVSGLNRLKCVHCMYSGVVLRDNRSVCSDKFMCRWKIFGCVIQCMHELFCGFLFD